MTALFAASAALYFDVIAPILSASEITIFSKPSSPLSHSCITVFERVDGVPFSTVATPICATITKSAPAAIPDLNGINSHSFICSYVRVQTPALLCVFSSMLPLLGKCLRVADTPVSCIAFTSAATISATIFGSFPNERSPISSLFATVITSATGAKSTLNPNFFRFSLSFSPTAAALSVLPLAPICAIGSILGS